MTSDLINTLTPPEVSVIVPVFNGAQWLPVALRSVYSQDLDRIEVIVLDDGSSDSSWDVVQGIADGRCVSVRHANRGLAATLNRGISMARGRYVARQDQDDIVLPGRLRKQFEYLEAHPEVAMVGTWAQIYEGENPSQRFHRHPCTNEAIRLELLFDNPFVHASVMIRTDVLRALGGYSEDKTRQPPEDYELWSRVARQYKVANLPEELTIYREFPASMSRSGTNPFTSRVIRIAAENLHRALPGYALDQCLALAVLYHQPGQLRRTSSLLTRKLVLRMFNEAAHNIAGPSSGWSAEFRQSYSRISKHIKGAFLSQRIPGPFYGVVRRTKQLIKTMLLR